MGLGSKVRRGGELSNLGPDQQEHLKTGGAGMDWRGELVVGIMPPMAR